MDMSIFVISFKRYFEYYVLIWLWVFIIGVVDFILDCFEFYVCIVDCEMEFLIVNCFGLVWFGYIMLMGFLIFVKVSMNWDCKSVWSKKMFWVMDNCLDCNN